MAKNLYFFQKLKKILKWAVSFTFEGIISKRGSKCKLQYYNEHFDIKTMEVRSGVEAGQRTKDSGFFYPISFESSRT